MRPVFILGLVIVALAAFLGFFLFKIRQSKEGVRPLNTLYMETVRIKAQDGVEIVGDYYSLADKGEAVDKDARGVLLLHMMPSSRKSWVEFAEKLQEAGFLVLAIDLRGHGESEGGPNGYKSFLDKEHQNSRLDVLAGTEFLRSKGIGEFHLVGASIGANLALQYAVEHSDAHSAVLLSPGLDYRGLQTDVLIEKISPARALFLVASEDDAYSLESVNVLAGKIELNEKHTVKIFEKGGHGTDILKNHPEFMDEVINWLKKL